MIWLLLTAILFILLSGFFAGSETAFMSANRLRIEHLAEKGDHRAKLALKLLSRPRRLLSTTLVGTNVSVVTLTLVTGILLKEYAGIPESWANLIISFGLTLLLLVVAEIIPKTVFQARADELSIGVSRVFQAATWIFYPVTLFVGGFSGIILHLTHRKRGVRPGQHGRSREDIELLASIGAEEGIISKTAQVFIHSVFSFGKTTVREIMTPLVDVVSIEQGRSINAAVRLIEEGGFSRIPVYRERVDDVMGYISAFDLVHSRKRDKLARYIRPAVFVPETKRIDGLLVEMRQLGVPLLFVVDEWGGTAGVVSHEDIAEHIVGQIRDRDEKGTPEIRIRDGECLVEGLADVDLLSEKLGLGLRKDGFETAGGFVAWLAQKIPAVGDEFEYNGYRIRVEQADATSVGLLRFTKIRPGRKQA